MKKKRKKTVKFPSKSRLRDIADRLWSLAVRDDWGNTCAFCGKRGKIDAHHLIPRSHYTTRYDICNGIALCFQCHKHNPDHSPHQNAAGFMSILAHEAPYAYEWYVDTCDAGDYRHFDGPANAQYFIDHIWALREYTEEHWESIVGVRFARYLIESMGDK